MDKYTVSIHTLDRGLKPEVFEVEAESPVSAVVQVLMQDVPPYPAAYPGYDLGRKRPPEYQRLSIEVRRE